MHYYYGGGPRDFNRVVGVHYRISGGRAYVDKLIGFLEMAIAMAVRLSYYPLVEGGSWC